MLLVQIGLVNFPRVVILAKGIEDVEVLLFWQVVDDELQVFLRREVVLKVDRWHQFGYFVNHYSRFLVYEQ